MALAAASLCGCAGAGSPPVIVPTPAPTPLAITGNWQMQVQDTSTTSIGFLFDLLGDLSVQGSTVTGTFRIPSFLTSTPCVPPTQDITFTGSVDASNLLTLTSTPFSGSTATLQLQLPINAGSIAHGTAQVTGGSCALAPSTLIGILVPPVTGTYVGTLAPPQFLGQPVTNAGGLATVSLIQSPANADGQFPVTATLSFTSPSCTLPATTLAGTVTGLNISLNSSIQSLPFSFPNIIFNAGAIPPGSGLIGATLDVFSSTTPSCANGFYHGDLTRQ